MLTKQKSSVIITIVSERRKNEGEFKMNKKELSWEAQSIIFA